MRQKEVVETRVAQGEPASRTWPGQILQLWSEKRAYRSVFLSPLYCDETL